MSFFFLTSCSYAFRDTSAWSVHGITELFPRLHDQVTQCIPVGAVDYPVYDPLWSQLPNVVNAALPQTVFIADTGYSNHDAVLYQQDLSQQELAMLGGEQVTNSTPSTSSADPIAGPSINGGDIVGSSFPSGSLVTTNVAAEPDAARAASDEVLRCRQGCRGTFRRPGDFRRHMRKHGQPRYKCLMFDCDKTFYRADKLRDHLRQGHKGFTL